MKGKIAAIVINEKDNVATALSPLEAGADVSVESGARSSRQCFSPISPWVTNSH